MIVDVDGSYERLIALHGGQYFRFDSEHGTALNLFYGCADVVREDGTIDPMKMMSMVAVLESLLVESDRPSLRNQEKYVLEKAIVAVYADACETPILEDLVEVLKTGSFEDDEDIIAAKSMAKALRYWTEGSYAWLLNRRSSIRMDSVVVGFDLKSVDKAVLTPVLIIIFGMIWEFAEKHRGTQKIALLDESWRLMSTSIAAQFVNEAFRTSRRMRLAILAIVHSPKDFQDIPDAKALLECADTAYLLKQGGECREAAKVFELNECEDAALQNLYFERGKYSEVLVLSGEKNHFVARITLTPLEYWVSTTHPPDIRGLKQVQASMPNASLLRQLEQCAVLWPRGVDYTEALTVGDAFTGTEENHAPRARQST